MVGKDMAIFDQDKVQLFDQQIMPARHVAHQTLDLCQRCIVQLPALGGSPALATARFPNAAPVVCGIIVEGAHARTPSLRWYTRCIAVSWCYVQMGFRPGIQGLGRSAGLMVRGRAFRFPFCSPTSPMSPPGMRYQAATWPPGECRREPRIPLGHSLLMPNPGCDVTPCSAENRSNTGEVFPLSGGAFGGAVISGAVVAMRGRNRASRHPVRPR